MALKLTPETCDRIMLLVSYGYTQRTIANMIGITEDAISRAKKTNPDLKRAITLGKTITRSDMKANIHSLAMTAESEAVRLSASAKALEIAESGGTATVSLDIKVREAMKAVDEESSAD